MVTENPTSRLHKWHQNNMSNIKKTINNSQRNVWGITDDIERSRTFARTLRPEPNRWWTAKYNNAPRYKGEMSSSKLQSSRLYQSAPDLMYSEYLEQGLSRSSRTMSLCNKRNSYARRKNLARTNSVAQSDLGVSYRGCHGDQEILIGGLGSGPGVPGAGDQVTVRDASIGTMTSHQQPVMVKTIELKERVNKDKVKIRYPFRSTSRPRLKHKINLQMEKAEGEES